MSSSSKSCAELSDTMQTTVMISEVEQQPRVSSVAALGRQLPSKLFGISLKMFGTIKKSGASSLT